MRYAPISSDLFSQNRARLCAALPSNSMVVLHSNDVLPTNADGTHPFLQNSDLFYLSGIDQEESILLLFPDATDPKNREILFLKETSETIAVWEGAKLTKPEGRERSGIAHVAWLSSFPTIFRTLMKEVKHVYLSTNEHARAADVVETQNLRFIRECQRKFPLHDYRRLAPLTESLRAIKSEGEIALLAEACRITEAGFRRALGFIRPSVGEWEIEAEYIHEFTRQRASGFAYSPIIASGKNSCVLHYVTNNATCQDGDILLMDVGARYANYNADLTRTIPVNGTFTERQRAVYDAVLRVQREAIALLRPGIRLKEYQEEIGRQMEKELIALKLLDRSQVAAQDSEHPLYRNYFMHGTSHHLGIDVHDVGDTNQPVQAGMVFTVEPGIYIPEENLGIRLENNIVIGESNNTDLMATIPIEAEEIETLMKES